MCLLLDVVYLRRLERVELLSSQLSVSEAAKPGLGQS